jgi:hypothetical protein
MSADHDSVVGVARLAVIVSAATFVASALVWSGRDGASLDFGAGGFDPYRCLHLLRML